MNNIFDLIVIGTGSGAASAARKCRKAGWRVAMADEKPFGGTCALRGCDMKKILMGAAEIMDSNIRMTGKGIDSKSSIVWTDLMAFKRTFIENYSENFEKELQESGIVSFHGSAHFVSESEIEIGSQTIKGEHFLIASGAYPMPLSIEGEENIVFSDYFLEMDLLPPHIIFIGGGMISMEFAHIAVRAGSTVTIVERQDRPLVNFDADLVALLVQKSKDIGIRFVENTIVRSVERRGDKYILKGYTGEKEILLESDLIVHGAGRIPNIDKLKLPAGNVAHGKNGVSVNQYMQSISNPKVYATGDAADTKGLPLTPVASMESHAAAANLLKGNHAVPDYRVMPYVVFTVPKIASVGLTEETAREMGYECYTNSIDTSDWYTYKRTNEKYAMAKIVIDKNNKCIIGAHLISNEADELVNLFAIAIYNRIVLGDLKKMMFAYPSAASDITYML